MAALHATGHLHRFSAFDASTPVWERIDRLPFVRLTRSYEELLTRGVEPRLDAAIRRLIKRSLNALAVAECLQAQNQDVMRINTDLESQLRSLQAEIAAMAETRVWRFGSMLRRCRDALLRVRATPAEGRYGFRSPGSRAGNASNKRALDPSTLK